MKKIDKPQEQSNKSQAYFLVFEGAHGSGKTTQAKMLYRHFLKEGLKACYTKEPYNKDLRVIIRKLSRGSLTGSPVLMHLLAADRFIHVGEIASWRREGTSVICDRYLLSSFVYQQMQGIPLEVIKSANSFALKPDLTFCIDAPLEQRVMRMHGRRKDPRDFFLRENKLVEEQELYRSLIADWDERSYGKIIVMDGEQSALKIHRRILSLLSSLLANHPPF